MKFVNLRVGAGEILGVMGESGSGKSTLATTVLRLLPAYAHPTAGAVLFEGRDVLTMRESELRTIRGSGIAMISQDPATSLNPVMKIGAQIGEVLRAHLRLKKQERITRVLDLLREVGFDDRGILQITLIASWFNYINRVADSLGVGRDWGIDQLIRQPKGMESVPATKT